MLEQLDIFSSFTPSSNPIVETQQTMLWKWRMFEYLDELKGKTAKITYQDDGVFYQVPFKFESLHFSSNAINSQAKDLVVLHAMVSKRSNMTFNTYSKSCLRAVEVKEGLHTFHYQQEVDKKWEPSCSKVMFELASYPVLSGGLGTYDVDKELSQLIGKTVQAKLRVDKDLINEIETLPFTITSVQLEGDQLTIMGTNDTIIRTKGYKGVRLYSELLIDVYLEGSGYTQTIRIL